MKSILRKFAAQRRQRADALAMMALVNKTSLEVASEESDGLVQNLFAAAGQGAAPSLRTTWRADGTLNVEFFLGDTAYGTPMTFANGHSTPLARVLFLAFVAAWRASALAFTRRAR